MKYEVKINDNSNDLFEEQSGNLATVKIYKRGGEEIRDAFVEIFLSRDALLGLGSELIRLAHKFKKGKHFHLEPIDHDSQIQRMGVFLTPDSVEIIICCDEFKTMDEYLK